MKATGMIRKVDALGRIVLPVELRTILDITAKDSLEIYIDESLIILRKYSRGCSFCGSMDKLKEFNGKNICEKCMGCL